MNDPEGKKKLFAVTSIEVDGSAVYPQTPNGF
jgi:hypothetical protein